MDRKKLAEECRQIEKRGDSVLDYLREIGCVSPWGTWHRLQKEELKRADHQITDGKGTEKMQFIMTDEIKAEAMRIAIEGGDPRMYLADCGSAAPEVLWWNLKRRIKEEDPETYAKLPERLPRKKKLGKAISAEATEADSQPEEPEEPKTRDQDPTKLKVTEAEGIAGRWTRYDDRIGLYAHRENGQMDMLGEMTPMEWEAAAIELPEVLRTFGVEA